MEKVHGKYRVARVTSMPDVVRGFGDQETKIRQMLSLVNEAKAKARPLVDFRLHEMRVEGERLQMRFEVVNKGTQPIERVQFVVLLKRTDTGAVALVETRWPSFYPSQLPPGQTKTAEDSATVSPVVAESVEAKRLVVSDVFPVLIEYTDDRRVDLVKMPD